MSTDQDISSTPSPVRAPDPILAELWEIRREINKEAGYRIDVLTRMAHEATEHIRQQWRKSGAA